MKEETKQVTEAILSNPKTSFLVVFMTSLETWWIEWGSPLVDATASILGLVLLIALIRYHLKNSKKLDLEIQKLDKEKGE